VARGRRSKRQVMVAENCKENRAFVCHLVEELNCHAIPVASSSEILSPIRDGRVDLVLLDLDFDLDTVKKVDALYEIKQLASLVPVVMMGRVMTPVLFRRLSDRGAQSFLQKPLDRNQLAITLYRNLL